MKCPDCRNILETVLSNEPYTNEHLQCSQCDGTFPIDTKRDPKQILEDLIAIQTTDGNWNYSPYMHGLANGLILAHAVLTDSDPKFLSAPDVWLQDQTYGVSMTSILLGIEAEESK